LEAAGVVEERGDFARGVAAGVGEGAAECGAVDAEFGAGGDVAECAGDLWEDFDGEALEAVRDVGAWVVPAEVAEGADAAAGEDVAEVDARGGDGGACGGAGDGAVLAGGETVEEGIVVELAGAGALLDEVVVKIVHAAGVGAEDEAVGNEVRADGGLVDAVVEVGEFGGIG
jgi:hypothetical protein